MSNILLAPSSRGGQPVTLLNTAAALASAAAALSATLANGASLDLYADLQFDGTFAAAPTVNTTLDVYFVRSLDGANFEDAAGGAAPVLPQNGFVGSFVVRAVGTAQRMIIPQILLPPNDFQIILVNNATGQSINSGWTLKGFFYHLSVA